MKKKFFFSALCLYFSFVCLNSNAQSWTQRANYGGSGRIGAVGFSISTKGYFGTGSTGSAYVKDFWEFDPSNGSNGTWTQKTDFPGTARFVAAGFSIGSYGYVGTGYDINGETKDFYQFDPSGNSWAQKADFGGGFRQAAVGFSIGAKGYIGTGTYGFSEFRDIYEYDPSAGANGTWTMRTSLGQNSSDERYEATGFSVGGKGYIGLGNHSSTQRDDFWEFDPAANSGTGGWIQKASFPTTARTGATGFGTATQGYVVAGQNGSTAYTDFYQYDPFLDSWTAQTAFSGAARAFGTGFSIGTKIYFGTGRNGNSSTLYNTFYEYSVAPALTTGPLSAGSYCQNTTPVAINFTSASIVFNSGNTFVAQLSNASGSFASPTTLGSITSTATSGTINVTIPLYITGSGYRIRVVSTNPSNTGSDNGSDITIYAADPLYITADQTACDEMDLTVYGAHSGATYVWSSSNSSILFNGGSQTTFSTSSNPISVIGTNDWIIVNTTNSCSQSASAGLPYNPFQRVINGLYPEYGNCADHVSISVNTTPYDTYYRWYVNSTLVLQGSTASSYCTCSYLGPDPRVNGYNTVSVDVETSCNANESAYGDFVSECQGYRMRPNVELYPNPAKDQVSIRLKQINDKSLTNNVQDIRMVKIMDKTGIIKGIYKYPPNSKMVTVNINNLPSDIYFVEISDGQNTARLQLSVQK